MRGTQESHEELGLAATCLAWAAALALGCGSVLAGDRIAAPLAAPAKAGLQALASGHAGVENLLAAAAYIGLIFLLPVAVLIGFTSLDALASRGKATYRSDDRAWRIQLLFLFLYNAAIVLIARLHLQPQPLLKLPSGESGLLHWIVAIPLFIAALIVSDLMIYWIHRAQHRFPWLWRFHAIHHSQKVDVLHNINHPLESIMSYVFVTLPLSLIVRFSAVDLLLLTGFVSIHGHINHMRAPLNLGRLGWLISDNRFHFVHHSLSPADFNTNFAAHFPFIDRIFGTYRAPAPTLPETGLSDHGKCDSLRAYLLGLRGPAAAGTTPDALAGRAAI